MLLPYTPVHHLLLETGGPLVMTSANRSDEPICFTADDAAERLPALADAVLDHDRPIHVPCDDSVVRVVDGHELPIRRSRGFAPLPIDLGVRGPAGARRRRRAEEHVLPHRRRAGARARRTSATWAPSRRCARSSARPGSSPPCAARPPGSPPTCTRPTSPAPGPSGTPGTGRWTSCSTTTRTWSRCSPSTGGCGEPIVGVAFDGTGYGADDGDATIWGGEFLLLGPDSHRFTRAAHLAPVPLPGGDAAVRHPRRMALAHLHAAGIAWDADLPPVAACPDAERRLLASQLATGTACVPTTSMGRLFDAVASLLGIRHESRYEAEAAMALEYAAAAPARWPRRGRPARPRIAGMSPCRH